MRLIGKGKRLEQSVQECVTVHFSRSSENLLEHSKKSWVLHLFFSCSLLSDSLRPHRLQHARLPCPSPSPGVWQGLQTATHSSVPAQRIPLTEEPGGLQSTGCKESDVPIWTLTHSCIARRFFTVWAIERSPPYLLYHMAKYRGTRSKTQRSEELRSEVCWRGSWPHFWFKWGRFQKLPGCAHILHKGDRGEMTGLALETPRNRWHREPSFHSTASLSREMLPP